ncbi:hypothetical protein E2C01_056735 [Portunus trituberculatus]|uniref:Uncharacterized protein n=1 Tax=Portunus trituberculatus TaxID=210409 RepID=A0A5B7GYJ3_PORTR|nr:hypothetical protein [Portunus trituberculatus]
MASASAELGLSIGGQESTGNDSESTIIGFTGEVRARDVIGILPHMEEVQRPRRKILIKTVGGLQCIRGVGHRWQRSPMRREPGSAVE